MHALGYPSVAAMFLARGLPPCRGVPESSNMTWLSFGGLRPLPILKGVVGTSPVSIRGLRMHGVWKNLLGREHTAQPLAPSPLFLPAVLATDCIPERVVLGQLSSHDHKLPSGVPTKAALPTRLTEGCLNEAAGLVGSGD